MGAWVIAALLLAQSGKEATDTHVAAAKAAAGQEHTSIFGLCTAPASAAAATPAPAQRGQRAAAQPPGPPDRSQWHAEPVKVFDNLYFVGMTEYSAWAVNTSDGIILIDAIYDYSIEDEVANGLPKVGLDPKNIKYVIISHGHIDHAGGAKFLQDRFGAHVIMGEADWDLLERTGGAWPKPRRDMIATDGQRLTLGDTTLTLHLTPGHTLGTISTLIPVKDGGRPHLAALWGGTGFNWTRTPAGYITPDRPASFWFTTYSNSAERFRDIVARAGADIILSNHTNTDASKTKLPALAKRKPGEPHPYVIGAQSVQRFLTVANECAKAGLARLN
ncbi:MAG TPA: MBL fold metallo-hydrolase [Terriglobia bacterium]|nr:MBL fold metallo-hydrolase [Terriglobia bacterium]